MALKRKQLWWQLFQSLSNLRATFSFLIKQLLWNLLAQSIQGYCYFAEETCVYELGGCHGNVDWQVTSICTSQVFILPSFTTLHLIVLEIYLFKWEYDVITHANLHIIHHSYLNNFWTKKAFEKRKTALFLFCKAA